MHYRFVTDEEFAELVAARRAARVGRVRRATATARRAQPVADHLAAGVPVLLEIELQGARQVRAPMPEALLVFLAPPSWDELVRRLTGRGTEDAAT